MLAFIFGGFVLASASDFHIECNRTFPVWQVCAANHGKQDVPRPSSPEPSPPDAGDGPGKGHGGGHGHGKGKDK